MMRSAPETLRRYLTLLVLPIGGFIALCGLVEWLGATFPILRRDPNVWGTYGDWAVALVPAAAIIVTVDLWMRDRESGRRLAAQPDFTGISLERIGGALTFANGSQLIVDELQTREGGYLPDAPKPGRSVKLPDVTGDAVVIRIGQRKWLQEIGQRPIPY